MAKWRKVKLADVCKFVRGPFGGSLKKDIFVSQGYAVFEQQHAIYGDFNKFRYFVTKDKFNEMQRFKLSPGDLIMSCSGTLGKVALVPEGIPNGIINQALLKLTPTDEVEGSYIKSWFESDLFTQSLRQNSGGAAIQNVAEVRLLKEIQIPLPPLAEQRKIAEILRTWDEAIETAEAELKAKQERKSGLMQRLLAPVAEGSGNGDNWFKSRLGVLGKFYSGLSGKSAADFGSGSPFISYNSVFGKSRCYIEGQPLVSVEKEERQNKVNFGDIILTGSSETADEVAMSSLYCDQTPAYLNSFCIGYSYDKERLIPEYAEHYFRGQAFRRSVFPLAQGSTRFNISRDELAKVEILIPSISEQRKISEILLSADWGIDLISNRIELLRAQKRGLMQKLLTGEVQVAA